MRTKMTFLYTVKKKHVFSPVFVAEAWDLLSLQENMFLQPVSEERVLEQLYLQATRLV